MDQTFDCPSICGLFDFFGRRVLVEITMARSWRNIAISPTTVVGENA
jgi:hypothetical protein